MTFECVIEGPELRAIKSRLGEPRGGRRAGAQGPRGGDWADCSARLARSRMASWCTRKGSAHQSSDPGGPWKRRRAGRRDFGRTDETRHDSFRGVGVCGAGDRRRVGTNEKGRLGFPGRPALRRETRKHGRLTRYPPWQRWSAGLGRTYRDTGASPSPTSAPAGRTTTHSPVRGAVWLWCEGGRTWAEGVGRSGRRNVSRLYREPWTKSRKIQPSPTNNRHH